jgi:hypothetical protein
MACIVYREGTGTIEHGIECESTTCEIGELHSLLAAGWLPAPPGYVAPDHVSEVDDAEDDDADTNEIEYLMEEIESLRKELDLRISIEANLKTTIEQLNGDLTTARQIEDRLNAEVGKLSKAVKALEEDQEDQEGDGLHPVRAAGRDAGIDGWESMHLSSLKKALKEQEA